MLNNRCANGVLGAMAVSVLVLSGTACGVIGGPDGWTAQELHVQARYDTLPDGIANLPLPLQVRYDTSRNAVGHARLYVMVEATNVSDRSFDGFTGGNCNWWFSAYDNPDRSGQPIWSDSLERHCRSDGHSFRIAPGGAHMFPGRWLPLDSIVGTRGPGTYYFSARLIGWPDPGAPSGAGQPEQWLTEWMVAGSIELIP